jgi:hypothetical protein
MLLAIYQLSGGIQIEKLKVMPEKRPRLVGAERWARGGYRPRMCPLFAFARLHRRRARRALGVCMGSYVFIGPSHKKIKFLVFLCRKTIRRCAAFTVLTGHFLKARRAFFGLPILWAGEKK